MSRTPAAGRRVIVGIGEILWDVFPAGRRLGGAPANFVYHVRELGGKSVQPIMVSCIGSDEPGRAVLADWGKLSLTNDYLSVDPDHPTGTVKVTVDPQGKPAYDIVRNAAWDYLPDSPRLRRLAGEADAICFGTLAQRSPASRETIRNFIREAGSGALRILDLNLRRPYFSEQMVEDSLSLADVLKINTEELSVLAGLFSLAGGEEAAAVALLHRWNLRMVALTKGDQGSALFSSDGRSDHPGYPAVVADTVGAGDAFSAAVAVGMLNRFPLERINECANRVASFVCTRSGAMPELPEEIKESFRR